MQEREEGRSKASKASSVFETCFYDTFLCAECRQKNERRRGPLSNFSLEVQRCRNRRQPTKAKKSELEANTLWGLKEGKEELRHGCVSVSLLFSSSLSSSSAARCADKALSQRGKGGREGGDLIGGLSSCLPLFSLRPPPFLLQCKI